ncbi:MAG: amidohydrolase [Candidatus Marinimicrobia bacterium]|nr:amidohydrolase [Candidatus Neomarinimicrobiota bacterium]
MNIYPDVIKIEKEIIETRRDIHKHPELGFQEHRTGKLVADRLISYGIDVQTGVGKTGVVGILRGRESGPTIALRADMDALPMQETGNPSYKSVNDGVMHACGHDGHVAMLLGAARLLAEKKDIIRGTVKFIFQPSEEGDGGARYMIADGCLEGVDEIYGMHLWNDMYCGELGGQPGPIMAAADGFKIDIHGVGGHGAAPQGTVDAVLVGAQLVNALQTIVSRNTDPLESTVVTVGKFEAGSNFNIISAEAHLEGTARSYTEENRAMIKQRMQEIIQGIETASGAKIDFEYIDGYPPTINHKSVFEKMVQSAVKITGKHSLSGCKSMGGEDFSFYLQKVPGSFLFVGSLPEDSERMSIPHHCSHFNIDERALLVGTSIFIQLVEDQLTGETL